MEKVFKAINIMESSSTVLGEEFYKEDNKLKSINNDLCWNFYYTVDSKWLKKVKKKQN